jgi:hypothetical protein
VSHHLSDRRLEPNVFKEFRGQSLRFYGVEEILACKMCVCVIVEENRWRKCRSAGEWREEEM